jgi:hypothetical protein
LRCSSAAFFKLSAKYKLHAFDSSKNAAQAPRSDGNAKDVTDFLEQKEQKKKKILRTRTPDGKKEESSSLPAQCWPPKASSGDMAGSGKRRRQ